MSNIQEVVRRCQEGQLDAFATLFSDYQNYVHDLACTVLRDRADAEDVVQDTFLAVFQHIADYRGNSTFKTWLTAVTVNQCRLRLRWRRSRLVFSLEQLSPSKLFRSASRGEDLSDVVQRRQQQQTLWQMIDDLPERLRLPMILRYRYALPCADIATVLNKRKSTIYQDLKEGRRELEKMAQQAEMRDRSPALSEAPGLE